MGKKFGVLHEFPKYCGGVSISISSTFINIPSGVFRGEN